jgi:hypothetical protein
LVDPYTALVTTETSVVPFRLNIPTTRDTEVTVSNGIDSLINRLRELAMSSTGVYIKTSKSPTLYHVYIKNTMGMAITGTTSSNGYSTLDLNGALDVSLGTVATVEYIQTIDQTITTHVGISELLYSPNRSAYTDGDDGQGLRYTYLGIPADTVPLGANFGRHCWRKQGYAYNEYEITHTNLTANVDLFGGINGASGTLVLGTTL